MAQHGRTREISSADVGCQERFLQWTLQVKVVEQIRFSILDSSAKAIAPEFLR